MNLLYGFISGALCVLLFAVWQYRKYVQSIRTVSDKWKGINDEWAARYHNLYDSWMEGVKPTAKQRMDWDVNKMMKRMSEMEYGSLPETESIGYSGLAEIIDSATKDKSNG